MSVVLKKALSQKILFFFSLWMATLSPSSHSETEFTYSVGGLTEDYLGRSEEFGQTEFNGLTVGVDGSYKRLDYKLSLAAQVEEERDVVPEFGLSLRFGNDTWEVGVSKEERHWSPSRYTSLILSRNAEYIPAVFLRKSEATRFNSKYLRWIGKFKGEFFIGQTNDSFNGGDSLFVGNQVVIQPWEALEIELVRTIQLGGDGQDTGGDVIFDALIGQTNEGTAAEVNQVAGAGLSYTFFRKSNPIRLYGQIVGEDEAGLLPSCTFDIIGIEGKRLLFGGPVTATVERVDTTTSLSEGGFCGPNAAFNNAVYDYTNSGRVLGAAIDTASDSLTLRVEHEFSNWSLRWNVGENDINQTSDPNHRLSSTNVDGILASIGVGFKLFKGEVNTQLTYQEFDLDNAQLPDGFNFGVNYSNKF